MPMSRPLAAVLLSTLLLAACAGTPVRAPTADAAAAAVAEPALQLAPASLGRELALQQRLTFRVGERRDTVDALVEADAASVRVLVHMQGQVALRLDWDGQVLQQQRADWLPAQLQGERVFADLQLVYWPAAAIRAVLPAGWQLDDAPERRQLRHDGELVVDVRYPSPARVELERPGQGLSLLIESTPVTP